MQQHHENETERDSAAKRYATVIKDGYEVPLIGIPPEAVLETCDHCGAVIEMRKATFNGKETLCDKCAA